MPNVQGFIQQYAPVAASVGQRIGVAPDVLLGQWGLETGWGKSVVPGTNNLGNIKGPGVSATDNQTGSNDQYRAYASPQAFGSDFADLISRKYQGALGTGSDASAYGNALQSGGYAEDSKYANKLAGAVGMVRKFGDAIASAISGSANASELSPQQMSGAPVISATGQQIMPQATKQPGPAAPASSAPASTGDPLLDMAHGVMAGSTAASPAPAATSASAQPAQAADDPLLAMANSVMSTKEAPKAAAQPTTPQQQKPGGVPVTAGNLIGATLEPIATAATGALASIPSTAVRLGAAALPGVSFDRAKQIGESVQNALTYHPQTAGGQQANADIGRTVSNALAPIVNSAPVKAITNAYQQNFVQNQSSPLMATINDLVPSTTAQIVAPEIAGRLNGLVKSIGRPDIPAPTPGSIELANRGVGPVPQGLPQSPVARIPVQPAANDLSAIMKVDQPTTTPYHVEDIARSAVAKNDIVGTNRPAVNDAIAGRPDLPQAPSTQVVGGAGAAANDASKAAPAAPPPAPAEVPKFDDSTPTTVKSSLAPDQQQKNLDLMREVGLNETRPSAISGDKFEAGNEYQLSKSDTPQGEVLRAQFDKERTALNNYSQQISQDTGARGASPEEVGQIIRQPLRDLNDYYDNAVKSVYQAADERAGGIAGIDADSFKSMMDTKSNFAGKSENGALGRGINAYLKEQGIRNADGTFNPMTAQQAEGVRQYINGQWSPQNSGLIGKVKEALDTDVAKSAGDDVYAQARALHAERKNVLDNPKGISSLLNEEGPNGVNQMVPDEKIGQKLTSMPVGQLRHIVETLKNAPEPLQPAAQQSLSEMKGVFADAVNKAGQGAEWNAAKVTKQLNDQRTRMGLLFDDAEMSRFRTLNDAGHVLQKPTAYPGAAVQGHNLLQKAVIWAPTAATTGAASALFGPLGAAVAAPAGAALTRKATEFVNRRAANKLSESFSNPRVDWDK